MKHGNFDTLAAEYGDHRPGYAPLVAIALSRLPGKPVVETDFVDVGAGTGIWTRMVAKLGCRTRAVEPSGPMRTVGISQSEGTDIAWREGSAEATGLESSSADLLTMASSFHWPDYGKAVAEFRRVLRPGGWFCALWNPRLLEVNPLLVRIEEDLRDIVPELKRVSSGRSEFCEGLRDRLEATPGLDQVGYLEARHVEHQSPERYMGLWRSVNDIRVQAGEERFARFLSKVEERIAGLRTIEATYLTRAWIARRAP